MANSQNSNTMKEKTALPTVGSPVRGSESGQPIMVLFDLLGRRWAMGILWGLSGSNRTFRDLQTHCGSASPSVLNTRLKELRAAHLIEKAADGYSLTEDGRALFKHLEPLGDWAKDWAPTLSNKSDL
ncbi:helix-turn-helix domain-containing protein [Marinomonas sp. 15G1-11]|uniref:Helix-turn-helix domain-containing protein n=1 Tax=Marinomonas phaeophyticola TaxID=3004091 RepID=A0ABT4JUE6_9GAMM|nr:helix-turn-helix domain-containing protein [Marinomonas sp. 15G1-11]MCZ2721969.1 helix-turn-helix domain-containing protein [Marinomonas sp. 15G1-11]